LKSEQVMKAPSTPSILNVALALGLVTVSYNIVEAVVSIWFGFNDDTLALLGFGIDSLVEVISGAGIVHMVLRMRKSPVESRDQFERQALRITGWAFYLLAAGMIIGALINLLQGSRPATTVPGIAVSLVSIATMWWLMSAKMKAGKSLHSDAIIADANCTKTCLLLSVVLLASSLFYELFHIGLLDAAGSLGIAWFAWSEGKESLEKARTGKLGCCCNDSCQSS
jgi:divalent metal cation (Fe/Co/Zn/Cd) transporter